MSWFVFYPCNCFEVFQIIKLYCGPSKSNLLGTNFVFGINKRLVYTRYIDDDFPHKDFIWFIKDSVLFRVQLRQALLFCILWPSTGNYQDNVSFVQHAHVCVCHCNIQKRCSLNRHEASVCILDIYDICLM